MATSISTGTLSNITSTALGTTHLNGMANGLDVDALVNAAMQAASLPLQLLQNKNTLLQAQKNDYTTIKTSLTTLRYAASDLTYSSTFMARKTATTNDKVATATAQNGSASGSYNINVTSLATTTYITGSAIANMSAGTYAKLTGSDISGADRNAALGKAGTLTINNKSIEITSDDTINTILNKISASGAGVTAKYDGGTIVLTQKTSGATPTVTIGEDSAGVLSALGLDGAPVLTPGTDADEATTFNNLAADNPLKGVTKGYFSINDTFISVDPTVDTLDTIISKINKSGAGVVAFYDATNKQISLTSKTAGDEKIVLGTDETDTSNFLTQVGLTTPAAGKQGKAAEVTVNGVSVAADNNKATFNGVTFTLTGTGTASVTVQTDTDTIVQKIQNFIDQYNTVIDQINTKLTEGYSSGEMQSSNSDDASFGDLYGDSTLRSISQDLRSFSYLTVASQSPTMQQLSQVGITTGAVGQSVSDSKTGHLSLDADKLRAAIESDPDAVASLFGNTIERVSGETPTGTIDGTNTTFKLAHGPLTGAPTVVVNGVTYTQVSGTPKSYDVDKQPQHQYSIDYATGTITFGDAPPSGAKIQVNYTYNIGANDSSAGIFVQMANVLNNYTQVGGTIDAIIGSDGSITNQIKYNSDRIADMNYRLQQQQASLYTMYQQMQTQLANISNQSSFLAAQLASLTSSSSSS